MEAANSKRALLVFNAVLAVLLSAPSNIDHCWGAATRKILQTTDPPSTNMSSTVAATEADYMVWLDKVAAKKSASSAATFSYSTAASDDSSSRGVIIVSKSGGADFSSVQAAVDSVPSDNSQRVVIQIAAGTYKYCYSLIPLSF